MKITLLNNSCFLLDMEGVKILIDPFISKKSLNSLSYDYCLISHAHIDHMLYLNEITKPVIAPVEICFKSNDIAINKTVDIKDIQIIPLQNLHPRWFQKGVLYDGLQSILAVKRFVRCKNSFGYIIKCKNDVLYYSGDTLYNEKMFENIKHKHDPNICLISFENNRIPVMNLLVPFNKYNNLLKLFGCPIVPVHQTIKWYQRNLKKYEIDKNIIILP